MEYTDFINQVFNNASFIIRRTQEFALSAELELARERIRVLECELGRSEPCPNLFGLTANEAQVFGIILKRSVATRGAIQAVLHGHRPADEDVPDPRIMDVYIHKIRQKLKPHGISIGCERGQGYCMSAKDKAKVAKMLEAER